jgi:hypothetical protein
MLKIMTLKSLRRGLGALALVALAATCGSSYAAEIQWRSHTSHDGRFTAKFPGEVRVEKKPNAIHTHAIPPGVDADFRVAYTDRDRTDANLEASFKELARIRQVTCAGQKIEAENVLEYLHDGLPACRFGFTKTIGATTAHYEMRFIMDGKRFYQVLYGYSVDATMKNEGEYFAKSFKINR